MFNIVIVMTDGNSLMYIAIKEQMYNGQSTKDNQVAWLVVAVTTPDHKMLVIHQLTHALKWHADIQQQQKQYMQFSTSGAPYLNMQSQYPTTCMSRNCEGKELVLVSSVK